MAKKTGSILDKMELNIDEEKISLINFYIKEVFRYTGNRFVRISHSSNQLFPPNFPRTSH